MVTVYRSGYIPSYADMQNEYALAYDKLSEEAGAFVTPGLSRRSNSVFACLTQEDAEDWVNWRIETLEADADIWAITLSDDVEVYAHCVNFYENSRYRFAHESVEYHYKMVNRYWNDRIRVTEGMVLPSEGRWEVLIPTDVVIFDSKWEKIVDHDWWSPSYYMV